MWELEIADREKILPAIFKLADGRRARHGIELRHMSRRPLRSDLDVFGEVYNAAWKRNWGFVPYSRRTSRLRPGAAARLRPQLVHGGRDGDGEARRRDRLPESISS